MQPHRRTRAYPLCAVVLALVLAWTTGARAEWVRVQWVLDGDSLRLADGREVRLIGVNTPEFGKDGRPDQPLAAVARDRARALVQNRTVRLDYDAERFDRYGRTLAYVALADGRALQETLLREGLAWFVAIPPNIARLAAHRAAETHARGAGRGIWGRAAYAPIPAERLTRADTGFLRIVATVASVDYRDGSAFLQLAASVHLALPHVSGDFPQAPEALVGKRVLARGWLTEYKNALRMRITHPAMLEPLP